MSYQLRHFRCFPGCVVIELFVLCVLLRYRLGWVSVMGLLHGGNGMTANCSSALSMVLGSMDNALPSPTSTQTTICWDCTLESSSSLLYALPPSFPPSLLLPEFILFHMPPSLKRIEIGRPRVCLAISVFPWSGVGPRTGSHSQAPPEWL